KVIVLINGKEAREVAPDSIPRGPNRKVRTLSVDLAGDPRLEAGKPNRVEVVAYNKEGYMRSRGSEVVLLGPGSADDRPPELWVVACGVSHYAGPALRLKYAAKDARDYAQALKLAGGRLFGEGHTHPERVHTSVMTTLEVDQNQWPTKVNLVRGLEALK